MEICYTPTVIEIRKGKVVAVCSSPKHGFPTSPRERVTIGEYGIPGDAHSGPMRESFRRPGTFKPNDRPISIVADEVRQEMNATLGLNMKPGAFNEQILVSGLGDMGDVPNGSKIAFSSGVTLEKVDSAYPCAQLESHNGRGLIQALARKLADGTVYSRRGILTRVLATGELQPGDEVTIVIEKDNLH